jgi:hypothetical protein
MIDMCNALGIEPVITTTDTTNAGDFARLVEYCHGNGSTPMGSKRHLDGHPEPYYVKYFELGNEEYNTHYVEQVEAMEAKARSLGIGNTLYYMFPSNNFLKDDDLAKAAALSPRIDNQLLADLHVVRLCLILPFMFLTNATNTHRPTCCLLNSIRHLYTHAGSGRRCRGSAEAFREHQSAKGWTHERCSQC